MALILALLACRTAPPVLLEGELAFLRGAVLAPGPVPGAREVGAGRSLVDLAWSPGQTVEVGGLKAQAPARAECLALFSVPLGDLARHAAAGAPAPDTALAFSPDGERLAVGSFGGEVLVLHAWTGRVEGRRRLAESAVKQVAWAPDGATLYVGEQSPDAYVRALDARDLEDRWVVRLADRVGTSALPANDPYGLYSLPAAYGLEVLPDGSLLVAATHGWRGPSGEHLNLAQLLRIDPSGAVVATWPEEPVSATFWRPRVQGGLAAVAVGRSADGPPPDDVPVGGVLLVDAGTLEPRRAFVAAPLAPWYSAAWLWEALDLDTAADTLFTGFQDGRVRLLSLATGQERALLSTGAPILAGEVPVVAGVGHGLLAQGQALFLTSRTNIPWGSASPDLRPPAPHPAANTLWAVDLQGSSAWSWTGAQALEGLERGPDGRRVVVAAAERTTDERRDLFGALVFDAGGPGRGGEERLEAFCATASPVFYRPAMSADGRVAVAEHPWRLLSGDVAGAYRVTVLR